MTVTPLPDGQLAAIVTFLEMLEPPSEPVPASALSLRRIERPELDEYRDLFRLVGSRWLWFSRLIMDDSELAAIIHDPKVELYCVADGEGRVAGMAELDLREPGQCKLSFLGLVPELTGMGHGRWLLAEVLRLAWREGIRRVHVHTCTLDHPAALPAYLGAGFTAFRHAVERFTDPRLLGVVAADCAPQVPVLGTVTSTDPRPAS